MATKIFLGTATAKVQQETVQITAYDAATTYTVTVGSGSRTHAVSVAGDTDVDTTASNLASAWNNETHPYCTEVTASVATDTVTFLADEAGAPFTIASSVTGGSGTIGSVSTVQASKGPQHWDDTDNWSTGSLPVSTDDVVIAGISSSILYGLDQNAVLLDSLTIPRTFTGKIGMPDRAFTTSVDGSATTTAKPEYREDYLRIGAERIDVGIDTSPVTGSGSGRIKIDNTDSAASTLVVHATASSPSDSGLPAVRYLVAHASSEVYVRGAQGGIGIATEVATETSTLSKITVDDPPGTASGTSKARVGSGVTIATWVQKGGTNVLQAAPSTSVDMLGGTLSIEGEILIGTLNALGGTVYPNNANASSVCVTTANVNNGTVNFTRSRQSRTVTTLTLNRRGTVVCNPATTFGSVLEPTGGDYTISVTEG